MSPATLLLRYWRSAEKWRAAGLLALIITLEMGTVYASVEISNWQRHFFDALADFHYAAISTLMFTLALLMALSVLSKAFSVWFTQLLTLHWRTWLVEIFLQRWLQHRAYQRLESQALTDNPDQRIAEDLSLLAEKSLSLGLGLLSNLANAVSFAVILWGLSGALSLSLWGHDIRVPGYMLWVAIAYALLGSWIMEKVGGPLVALSYQRQRYEADFRYQLVRVREHAEQIAFYRGEKEEARRLHAAFAAIRRNWRSVMTYSKRVAFTETLYIDASSFVPYLFIIPRYFAKEITIGGVMQMSVGFSRLRTALSWFLFNYQDLALLRAALQRLCDFDAALCHSQHSDIQTIAADDGILRIRDLHLHLPDGTTLCTLPDTDIRPGERWMIVGGSGNGKSTLLRTLAGLWPYGSGSIALPGGTRLFLPQRSYLPVGTLREALCYPTGVFDDIHCREALRQVRLDHILDALDQVQPWDKYLSGGEQQRLAFARILLQRPDYVFLDEATSALDRDNETHLYQLLSDTLPTTTVISVTHHAHLAHWHHHQLQVIAQPRNSAGPILPSPAESPTPLPSAQVSLTTASHIIREP